MHAHVLSSLPLGIQCAMAACCTWLHVRAHADDVHEGSLTT